MTVEKEHVKSIRNPRRACMKRLMTEDKTKEVYRDIRVWRSVLSGYSARVISKNYTKKKRFQSTNKYKKPYKAHVEQQQTYKLQVTPAPKVVCRKSFYISFDGNCVERTVLDMSL